MKILMLTPYLPYFQLSVRAQLFLNAACATEAPATPFSKTLVVLGSGSKVSTHSSLDVSPCGKPSVKRKHPTAHGSTHFSKGLPALLVAKGPSVI